MGAWTGVTRAVLPAGARPAPRSSTAAATRWACDRGVGSGGDGGGGGGEPLGGGGTGTTRGASVCRSLPTPWPLPGLCHGRSFRAFLPIACSRRACSAAGAPSGTS
eukprot:scaffold15534_cov57-Phaeocystis_antarctica.AAC.4